MQDPTKGRTRRAKSLLHSSEDADADVDDETDSTESTTLEEKGYIDMERSHSATPDLETQQEPKDPAQMCRAERDTAVGRVVDVVLSDMSAPWEQTSGFHKRSISDPYHRMMNTSGMAFRDHAGSMVSFLPEEVRPSRRCDGEGREKQRGEG